MLEAKLYSVQFRNEWNSFLSTCKNRHFMFHRDYMDYHADRYVECSQLLFKNSKIVGLLPANREGEDVISHGMLTFGGVLCNREMTTSLMLEIFRVLIDRFRSQGIENFIYKAIPHIYHEQPAEEDLYALFRNNACLYRRDVSSAINLKSRVKISKGRKWGVSKAKKNSGLEIRETEDLPLFWKLLDDLLEGKYGKKPVHDLSEIQLLKRRFPDQIKFFGVYLKGKLVGGTLVFENGSTVHTQYIASDNECREFYGLDLLFSTLITDYYADREIFNFGISNEREGWELNKGLISFKEGFGARAIAHDFYRMRIAP